jgi:hypothetical protein
MIWTNRFGGKPRTLFAFQLEFWWLSRSALEFTAFIEALGTLRSALQEFGVLNVLLRSVYGVSSP